MKVLVIIPAHNEAENILHTVADLKHLDSRFDCIVVNDGSTDATLDICRKSGVNVLDLPINLGLADAVGTGMKYAWFQGYDAAVQFDGDGQHKAKYLPSMLEQLSKGCDIVCGSRYLSSKKPLTLRMLGSRLITLSIWLITGKRLSDPTSGLRMFSRRIIGEFAHEINYPPEPDTISHLIRKGAEIAEIPVEMNERIAGKSYLNAANSVKYMLRIFLSILIVQWFRDGALKRYKDCGCDDEIVREIQ
ncbi:MAG: glycosyltransferase family 2 protein [Clostridiales Family XIII bacterium]|nr:glycosyltransferase family 2 protein [Clostridiales Family XIII bacterium]